MGEVPNCNSKAERKKGPWTKEEDQKMLAYIQQHGHGSWRSLPSSAGLKRCGKSCRLRWTNYLRPDIKRGKLSTHEEEAIIRLHALLGNRWSCIAALLPKRTENEIKNYWNTRLKKRLTRMGIDPATHKPRSNPAGSAQSRRAAALSHAAQWEAARLQAEARLEVYKPKPPPPPPPCLFDFDFSGHGATVTPMNSYMPYDDEILCPDYCDLTAPVDLAALNQDYKDCSAGGGEGDALAFVGEFEDGKKYWNYLLKYGKLADDGDL